MKRLLASALSFWKQSDYRKPIVLQGARQVGKTHLLRDFGEREYDNLVYLNFEDDPELEQLFAGRLEPRSLLRTLSRYARDTIEPQKTLLIFDEVQHCNRALNSLKYFAEQAPAFHVAAAGSLIGVQLSRPESFPVGKVNLLTLYPLTINEFLGAVGDEQLLDTVAEGGAIAPLPTVLHRRLLAHLASYYYVGGMPEAVQVFARTQDLDRVREVHHELVTGYRADFGKHAPKDLIPKLNLIWDSIPGQLARENKKFIYSAVARGARARGYEDALQWLAGAGLIQRCTLVKQPLLPLSASEDRTSFKIYLHDIGLLGAMAGLTTDAVATRKVFDTFRGAFVENYVAQQLTAGGHRLHYWRSSATAEVDFVVALDGQVMPLEAKAGVNPRSKSMRVFQQLHRPALCLRSSTLNLRHDGEILNVPLYAINQLLRLAQMASPTTPWRRLPRG